MAEPSTIQAWAACFSAAAAIASAVAAWVSRVSAKESSKLAAELHRAAAVREISSKAQNLHIESARAVTLCTSVRSHSQAYANIMGALNGSAQEETVAAIDATSKELLRIHNDVASLIARIPALSKGDVVALSDPLSRIDANLNKVRLIAEDLLAQQSRLMDLMQAALKH